MINYEQEVKKIHKDAVCGKQMDVDEKFKFCIMRSNIEIISGFFSRRKQAWKSTYKTLKQQGKL